MLVFPSPEDPAFHVKLAEMTGWQIWNRVEDLSQSGPEDRHFELDAAKGILTFGNGVNGRLAPQDAAIQVDYRVCSGGRGNVAKGMRWSLAGIVGEFGTNREVLTGGADAQDLGSLRALARARSRTTHPLVTSQDLIEAALAQTDLGVARAMELEPRAESQRPRGERVLVIVGPRDDDGIAATEGGVESAELLETVRSRLAPRLPVGERLQVRGPVYVPLKIAATLVAAKNTDIEAVRSNVIAELRTRLALVAPMPEKQWPFGRDVTDIAVKGWLRKVHGVARVSKAGLFQGPIGVASPVVKLRPVELPLLRIRPEDIVVERAPLGKIS
jgi:predicted phage baseplate assembly protein